MPEFTSTGTAYVDEFFAHHGIKGQKWGIRRYQNPDGSLTDAGRKRYNKIVDHYKNDKGEFSARKSTKASVATALAGGSTGLGLTLAGLPMVGAPVAAASGAVAIAGALKRERARRFLENTGMGDIKDISLDRRYATNFDILGLGALINTAYGTHREKVAERIKNTLSNTKVSDIMKDATETKGKTSATDAKEAGKEKTEKNEAKEKKEYKNTSELYDAAIERVKNAEGKTSSDITPSKIGFHPIYNEPHAVEKRRKEWRRLANAESDEINKLLDEERTKQKAKTKNQEYKKMLDSSYQLPEVNQIEKMFKNAKTMDELNSLWGSEKVQDAIEKAITASDKKQNEIAKAGKGKSNTMLYSLLEDQVTYGGDDFYDVLIPKWYNERQKQLSHSDTPGVTFDDILAAVEAIEHSGILGQKWGLRRFQNPDGTLTEAGRKRYAKKGTAKLISDKEKYRAQKAKWARDPASLYKHKDEYTKAELDKAMEVFASQNRIKAQLEADKAAKQKAKEDLKKSKIEYKKLQLQDKMNQAKAEEDYKQLKLKTEQAKLQNKQNAENAKKNQQFASKDAQIALWKKRADKAKNVMDFAKAGKTILDDMGITSKEEGESLLGSLAVSLGIKDISAQVAKKEAKEKQEKVEGAIGFMNKIAGMYKNLNEGNKNNKFEIKFDNDKTENLTLDDILKYFETNKFVS